MGKTQLECTDVGPLLRRIASTTPRCRRNKWAACRCSPQRDAQWRIAGHHTRRRRQLTALRAATGVCSGYEQRLPRSCKYLTSVASKQVHTAQQWSMCGGTMEENMDPAGWSSRQRSPSVMRRTCTSANKRVLWENLSRHVRHINL